MPENVNIPASSAPEGGSDGIVENEADILNEDTNRVEINPPEQREVSSGGALPDDDLTEAERAMFARVATDDALEDAELTDF